MEPFLKEIMLLRERVESFDVYPFNIPAIRSLERLQFHPHVTFFAGETGSGKSTFLEAIALLEGFNLEGGSRSYHFSTRESHSTLGKALRSSRGTRRLNRSDGYFLRAESFYNVATYAENLGVGDFHNQSHGESFMSLLCERFHGNGLYLLDEPESALSPSRQLSLLSLMSRLVREDSQLIIATHSPILLAYPDAWIYQFSEQPLCRVEYQETEQFRVTKTFLDRREQMLEELMRPD